jgi:hypothetical protein
VVASARSLKADERALIAKPSSAEIDRWCADVTSSPEMLRFYEELTGDRLRPPTTIDIEHRVKPALYRAFHRGELVTLDRAPAPSIEKRDDGVHGKKAAFEAPAPPEAPRKAARPVSEKTFLDVRLVNGKGKPIAGCKFKLQLPSGVSETGTLGSDARIAKAQLDPGVALLTFEPEHVDVVQAEPIKKSPASAPASQPKPKPPPPTPTPTPGKITFELGVFDKLHPSDAMAKLTVSMDVPGQTQRTTAITDAAGMIRLEEPDVAAGTVDVVGIADESVEPFIRYDEFAVSGLATNQSHVLEVPDKRRVAAWVASQRGIARRAAWGAKPPKVSPMDQDWDYEIVVIHHSGDGGETDPKEIQAKHFKEAYDDVGYHYMVHPNGTVYEGRYLAYKGSHVLGANTKKLGILVMGDFEHQVWDPSDDDPTKVQIASAQQLILTLKKAFPTLQKLGGHRDYKVGTACPGDVLYAILGGMRAATGLGAP